jgi:HK97 family phage major capsid protein/HK97 family phage prohead protease
MKNKAYSTLVIKAIDEEKREIRGIASTPETDRMGDIVLPKGATFKLPMPFLWQHNSDEPIGEVIEATVTAAGIEIVARLVQVTAPQHLVDRLEEAWQSIKTGLVRGLSIGFQPIKWSQLDSGGYEFQEWGWHELSAVTIPANASGTITSIKSFDQKNMAALGRKSHRVVSLNVGASTVPTPTPQSKPLEGDTMNLAEQIKQYMATREAKGLRMTEILEKASKEGRTFDAQESEEFNGLNSDIESIDAHLTQLKAMEKLNLVKATPVADESGMPARTPVQAPAIVKTVKNDEPGIGLARFALAMYAGKGNISEAKAFAEHRFGSDTRLQGVMKAAVAAGTTTNAGWAGNLVDYNMMTTEFLEFLRPRTIIGQFGVSGVPNLRKVPFNVEIPGKTASGTANWVGEGYAKPVTSSAYAKAQLKWAKIAAISVITEELDRFSDLSIQTLVRDDLAEAVIERVDYDFVNPAKAAGTGATASPASITNGVTPIASSGSDAESIRADISALWEVADGINMPASSAVYITDSRTARALGQLRNALGQREFDGVTMLGGNIDGVPVIVSNYVPSDSGGSLFILAFASEIYLADDGVVTIDVSREASILMDSAPNMNSGTPTAAQLVSMFQTNSLAIRAERYINWAKRRPQAVAFLENVNWGAPAS